MRANLECVEDVGFLPLCYAHGRVAGVGGSLRIGRHLGHLL